VGTEEAAAAAELRTLALFDYYTQRYESDSDADPSSLDTSSDDDGGGDGPEGDPPVRPHPGWIHSTTVSLLFEEPIPPFAPLCTGLSGTPSPPRPSDRHRLFLLILLAVRHQRRGGCRGGGGWWLPGPHGQRSP